MRARFRSRRNARQFGGDGGFSIQDIGDTGWEFLTLAAPSPVTGTTSAQRLDKTNTGSRLYYILPSKPVITTTLAADQDGRIYFWNGAAIIDEDGSTTNPGNGLAYGTDPLNPNEAAIRPFKRWSYVGPRWNPGGDIGTANANIGRWDVDAALGIFRGDKPDYWLFRRGPAHACDLYEDLRTFLDDMGLTTTKTGVGISVRTAGGRSATERAVIGAYGPVSDGRAELKNPPFSFWSISGANHAYSTYFGIRYSGVGRDRPVRPVDWDGFSNNDYGYTAQSLGIGAGFKDVLFEDVHFDQVTDLAHQWNMSFTNPIAEPGLRMKRYLVTDVWNESSSKVGDARRKAGDADQSWPAGTTTRLTFVTAGSGNSAAMNVATGTLTAAANTHYKAWYLLDVQATIPVGGSIEVLLYRNGAEVAGAFGARAIPGTGVTDDIYKLHGIVYSPKCNAGDTLDVRVRTTSATGTVTVLGGFAKLQFDSVSTGNLNGTYINTSAGAKVDLREFIMLRNGFNTDPAMDSAMPDGTRRRDWDIRNHNIYYNGDALAGNFIVKGGVSMLGAAGDTSRSNMQVTENFFYNGYFGITPHGGDVGGTGGKFNDNVLQRYISLNGTFTAHPGWGFEISNGTVGFEIKRNIISDVAVNLMGRAGVSYGVKVSGQKTPYWKNSEILWERDVQGTLIDGNIIDVTGTSPAFMEANGAADPITQWQSPVTGAVIAGGTLTCTPTSGWASGAPTYQWMRWSATGSIPHTDISGATASTYVLQDLARTHRGSVADQAAMLALSAAVKGDVCYRTDTNVLWEFTGTTPATLSHWSAHSMLVAGARAYKGRVADATAMGALSASSGDYCFRIDLASWFELNGSTWKDHGNAKTFLDVRYDAISGAQSMVACQVGGVVYPAGVGITGTTITNNVLIKPAAGAFPISAVFQYGNMNANSDPSGTPVYTTTPPTSDATLSGNVEYANRAAAAAALGWSLAGASLKTHLQSLGVTVSTFDGFDEYFSIVTGSGNPTVDAMRYGRWDDRLLGRQMGNHVRAGRGMAEVA